MNRSETVFYPVTDSTNRVMREYIQNAPEGFTVVAERQTGGKGRMGRQFYSPEGGLYASVLLKPNEDNFSLITASAAVAVTDVLFEKFGVQCGIKWVNDITLNGKKICGILAESVFSSNVPTAVILGYGINLALPKEGFPNEIRDIAGCLNVTLSAFEKMSLAEDISRRIVSIYKDPESFTEKYKKRSTVIGREIYVIKTDGTYNAKAIGIDRNCGLIVDYGNKIEVLRTGEISVRIK